MLGENGEGARKSDREGNPAHRKPKNLRAFAQDVIEAVPRSIQSIMDGNIGIFNFEIFALSFFSLLVTSLLVNLISLPAMDILQTMRK